MDHEKSRLLKIANEISFYCFNLGAENIHIDISTEGDRFVISVNCQIQHISEDELEKLKDNLEVPRRYEVEEYLYELAGESQGYRELSLVGMMIDKVEIIYQNSKFKITMFRDKLDKSN